MDAADLYLDLLKKCLTRYIWEEDLVPFNPQEWGGPLKTAVKAGMAHISETTAWNSTGACRLTGRRGSWGGIGRERQKP